jgi:hypothetical protein
MTSRPRDNNAYRFPVAVKGVLIRDGRVILLRNDRDEWELPGGNWVYSIVPGVHVLVLTYGCSESSRDDAVLSDEHKALKWFPLAEVDSLRMPDGYKASIRTWSAHLRSPGGP